MSKRNVVLATLGVVIVAVVAWRLRPQPPTSEEDRVRAVFEDAARAAEARRPGDVVEALSDRFHGGGLDRRGAKQLVAYELLRGQWVSVTIAGVAVAVDGPSARANVDAVLSRAAGKGKSLSELLPGEASAHRFRCALEREDGAWRVVSAEWRPIDLAEALAGPPPPEAAADAGDAGAAR